MMHVYVRGEQGMIKLQKNILRAARGPRHDAIVAWTEIYPPGRKLGVEAEKFGAQRAAIEEFLRGSTRNTAVFHLCINTDTDPRKLGGNIERAARGPRFDDVMSVLELYEGDGGRKIWDLLQQLVRRVHADPTAKPVTL